MFHFNHQEEGFHETPTKKIKESAEIEPKTAESHQKLESMLEDVDASQLFMNFHNIIKVVNHSEEQPEEVAQEVQRKLTYSPKTRSKLFLSPSPVWSSMKKKPTAERETIESIVLFEVVAEDDKTQVEIKQIDMSNLKEEDCHTPKRRGETREWSTPKKVVH